MGKEAWEEAWGGRDRQVGDRLLREGKEVGVRAMEVKGWGGRAMEG